VDNDLPVAKGTKGAKGRKRVEKTLQPLSKVKLRQIRTMEKHKRNALIKKGLLDVEMESVSEGDKSIHSEGDNHSSHSERDTASQHHMERHVNRTNVNKRKHGKVIMSEDWRVDSDGTTMGKPGKPY